MALAAREVLGQDDTSLLQHTVQPRMDATTASLSAAFKEVLSSNKSRDLIKMAPRYFDMMNDVAPRASLLSMAKTIKKETDKNREVLGKGWNLFFDRSHGASDPAPRALLHQAKVALLETGAMEQMRRMAVSAAKHQASTQGVVPLDSMVVGFKTSFAPWNAVLKQFSMPLLKAQFSMFTNFFGPEGNAARLCLGAHVAIDSTYGVHSQWEFGGVNMFVGPTKWDNVPGWQFGATGGVDNLKYFDAADFGWSWTLAQEPETIGFYFDMNLIDSEGLHAVVLQTANQVVEEVAKSGDIKNHGSSSLGHIWCSPDWDNTPLTVEGTAPGAGAKSAAKGAPAKLMSKMPVAESQPTAPPQEALKAESWDPQTEEAV